jgi:hypothetical protein
VTYNRELELCVGLDRAAQAAVDRFDTALRRLSPGLREDALEVLISRLVSERLLRADWHYR